MRDVDDEGTSSDLTGGAKRDARLVGDAWKRTLVALDSSSDLEAIIGIQDGFGCEQLAEQMFSCRGDLKIASPSLPSATSKEALRGKIQKEVSNAVYFAYYYSTTVSYLRFHIRYVLLCERSTILYDEVKSSALARSSLFCASFSFFC